VELTVKITPRVAAQVAGRLRLAASVRSRGVPAVACGALDEALRSLEEIRRRLALPAAEAAGCPPDITAGRAGQVVRARSSPDVSLVPGEGTGNGSVR
jgi:hypothetical protein